MKSTQAAGRFRSASTIGPLSFDVKVANGSTDHVRPIAARTVTYVVRNGEKNDLHVTFQLPAMVSAPIAKDQELGEIIVREQQQQVLGVIPAVSPIDVVGESASPALMLAP